MPCDEQEKLQAIQQACGARLTQQGTENVCLGVKYSKCAPETFWLFIICCFHFVCQPSAIQVGFGFDPGHLSRFVELVLVYSP